VTTDVRRRAVVDEGSSSIRTARRVCLSKCREALLATKTHCTSCRSPRRRGDTRRIDLQILPNERASDLYPTEAGSANSGTVATEPRQRELLVGPKLLSTLRYGVATAASSSHTVYVAAELADMSA
jgi:hypothetical protein